MNTIDWFPKDQLWVAQNMESHILAKCEVFVKKEH